MTLRLRRRTLLATVAAGALSGCGEGTWLGENAPPPLAGERKSVLLIEDPLSANSRIAELNITLPPPEPNADWPQSGGNPAHAMQHLSAAETITEAWSTKIGAAAGGRSWILADRCCIACVALPPDWGQSGLRTGGGSVMLSSASADRRCSSSSISSTDLRSPGSGGAEVSPSQVPSPQPARHRQRTGGQQRAAPQPTS